MDGAVDALHLQRLLGAKDWGIARVLYRLEGYNGYGYHLSGINSPYLYGGSTAYGPPESKGGKYVSDGVFDPKTVDRQLGTAVILQMLMELDHTLQIDGTDTAAPTARTEQAPLTEPDDELAEDILWVQQSLNNLGADPQLVEDGKIGPKTMAAVSKFQRENGLHDTGVPDAATISAIQRKIDAPVSYEQPSSEQAAAIRALVDQLQKGGKIMMHRRLRTRSVRSRPGRRTRPPNCRDSEGREGDGCDRSNEAFG